MLRFLSLLLMVSPAFSQLVINEVDYDQVGTDASEFVELKNTSASPVNLSLYKLEFVNGATSLIYDTILLPNVILQPGAYFVICANTLTVGRCDLDDAPNTDFIQNGSPDGIVLKTVADNTVIDAFSYEGNTTGATEGTGTSAADSNTVANISLARFPDGSDTNNNTTDFSIRCVTPGAANVAASSSCPAPPVITSASPLTNGTANTPYSGQLTGTGGVPPYTWSVVGGSLPAGMNLNASSGALDGTPTAAGVANFTVRLADSSAVPLIDSSDFQLTIDSGQPATCTVSHTISQVQGSGQTSPLTSAVNQNGTVVTVEGVVTAVISNGFFLQSETGDGNPATSDGIFVFTSSAPPAQAVRSNKVCVTGPAFEFRPAAELNFLPVTEINLPTTILQTGVAAALPAPVTLNGGDPSPSGALDGLEKYEGMRVSVPSMTVTGAADGGVSEANATSSLNGEFYGVVNGVARPFREPGIEQPEPLPPGAPVTIPIWNGNPERIFVDSNRQTGAPILDVSAGQTVSNLVGPLHYGGRDYQLFPDADAGAIVTGSVSATAVPVPNADEFTVASTNLERFFDDINDPATGDPVLTPTALANRLNKVSLAIRNVMRSPDVVAVEEVEDLGTLQALAAKINGDTVAKSLPNPNYQAFLTEGNDPGGIDVGFLVKTAKVNVFSVVQVGKNDTYIDPNNGQPDTLNDRPPLVLQASVNGIPFTVIVVHQRSLLGIDDPTDGNRVRTKRRAQAEFLANYIQSRQQANSSERIVVLGDFNAFDVNDGYVDAIGTVRGQPTSPALVTLPSNDLVNPDLTSLADTFLPAGQRYSYVFRGNAQTIDHILANPNMLSIASRFAYARNNADFSESFRNDSTRPERFSDHDIPVAYFRLPATALSIGSAVTARVNGAQANTRDYTVRLTNLGAAPASDCAVNTVSFQLLNGTGALTLLSALPVSYGALAADGGNASRTMTVGSPATVQRFTMHLAGSCGSSPFTTSVTTFR